MEAGTQTLGGGSSAISPLDYSSLRGKLILSLGLSSKLKHLLVNLFFQPAVPHGLVLFPHQGWNPGCLQC